MEASPNDLDLLTRFICTGSEEGCFNVHEKPEFKDKTPCLSSFLTKESGCMAVRRLKHIFIKKSFVSKEPLLYALARIIRNTPVTDMHKEDKVRQDAYALVERVCETAEDLFTFVEFDKKVSDNQKAGWGGGMRRLVHRWYETKPPRTLASLVTRCKSARGWSHRDVVRQCHIAPQKRCKGTSLVVNYLVSGKKEVEKVVDSENPDVKELLTFFKDLHSLNTLSPLEKEAVRSLIEKHKLLDRQIPSKFYKLPETYVGMLCHMSTEDVYRNVHKMATMGILEMTEPASHMVVDRIGNLEAVREEKVNPLVILSALRKYRANRNKAWVINPPVVHALKAAFDVSVELLPKLPGSSMLVAVHLEGDQKKKLHVKGATYVTPSVAAAYFLKFMHQSGSSVTQVFCNDRVEDMKVDENSPIVKVLTSLNEFKLQEYDKVQPSTFDLVNPINWARQKEGKYDNILIITDLKKVASPEAFREAVRQYRIEASRPNCKVAVIGLSDLTTSVADKTDLNILEVSGLNEVVPYLVLRFFQGQLNFDPSGDIEEGESSSTEAGGSA